MRELIQVVACLTVLITTVGWVLTFVLVKCKVTGRTEKIVLACASFSLGTGFGMGTVGVLMCKCLM